MNDKAVDIITAQRLVAIIRLDDLTHAVELSRALLSAGVVAQEFTLTNPTALAAISKILEAIPQFSTGAATIGVGSVRTPDQVNAAARSGAQFIVSPNTDMDVIAACKRAKVPIIPGALTPTEISYAWKSGAAIVKVFPARSLGPTYIADVLGPMPELQLMPTGGVDQTNMQSYIAAGAVAVGVGVNALNKQAIINHEWSLVTETARRCVNIAKGN